MIAPLTPAAALLLRRILMHEDSRLPLVHTQTDAMTTLVDELEKRKLITTVMGTLAPLPPTAQPQRHAATLAARALLTEGTENTEARVWLTALGVPIEAPETPRPHDAWMGRISSIPQRRITVEDVLRTAPEATIRGDSTPADEVEHWLTAMVNAKQVRATDDGVFEFPLPSDADLDAALVDLRDGKFITPRTATELVMRGDAVVNTDGTVVPASGSQSKTATTTARPVASASGTSHSKTAPATAQTNGTAAPATGTKSKAPKTSVSQPETTPVTIGDQILGEVRELRRDMRQALDPITAPKVDAQSAEELLAASDPMTKKVLVRVVVLLHVYGEMARTPLRKKMNSRWLAFLPEAIRLGLRLGVLDANAKDGTALRLIDHSKVVSNAVLESKAAEQRERDGDDDASTGVLGGLAHAARTLTGAVS